MCEPTQARFAELEDGFAALDAEVVVLRKQLEAARQALREIAALRSSEARHVEDARLGHAKQVARAALAVSLPAQETT